MQESEQWQGDYSGKLYYKSWRLIGFSFLYLPAIFFSYLHLQSSWLLIKRTLTHLHRLNRKTCTTFFFFFFVVPFAKICDRFIHRQRQRFSPTFVFLWSITNLQQLLLLNRDFRRLQKLSNNKSLWRKACSTTQQDENATRFRFKSYVRQVLLSVLVCLGLAKKKNQKTKKLDWGSSYGLGWNKPVYKIKHML